ncbi:aminotransferase-like domain-containing protein [Humidesulfovibrio idahonensis]
MTMWTPQLPDDRPKYLALADAIEADIASGSLAPGQRLPTHRDLADTLGVTVGTVTRGYAEAARRGAVRGEVGRGTIVCSEQEGASPWWSGGPDAKAQIDLGLVTGMYGLDPDLGSALRELSARPDVQDFLRYQPSRGMARHREAGAKWCGRFGVEVSPEQVLVTAGGQHALLVLFSVLFRPGDRIAAGNVNYPGLITAASLLGLKLVPVALDAEGVIPEALDEACLREGVRGLYCMPGAHNPTTATPSPARQERLAELARERNLLVVEDAAYALTAFEPKSGGACHALASLAPERSFFVASVSKVLAGGLRVGYVASPAEYVARLALGITGTTWMASPLCGEIAAAWILDGTAEVVMRRKLAEAVRRNEVARRVLAGYDFAALPQGYFIWLKLPEPWRAADFERAAALRGVVVIAGDSFAVGQTPAPAAVRVSLSAARNRDELERGLAVLADLLRDAPRPGRAIV